MALPAISHRIRLAPWLAALVAIGSSINAYSYDMENLSRLRQAYERPRSEASLVNDFLTNSRGAKEEDKTVQIDDLVLQVRLLTPLNSDLNKPGDLVKAIVTVTPDGPAGSVLPSGTVLEGLVEQTAKSERLNRNGRIYFTFYWAQINGKRFGLRLATNTADGAMHPAPQATQLTRKQKLRRMLILTSSLSIPMAVGTGGLSLAISAGAGAVIGGLLADDKHYFKGMAGGALQGSGLAVLSPLVRKGRSVNLAWGLPLQLKLADPVALPEPSTPTAPDTIASLNGKLMAGKLDDEDPEADLETSAKVLDEEDRFIWTEKPMLSAVVNRNSLNPADKLAEVKRYIDESNLACALQAASEACQNYPGDKEVLDVRNALFNWATGKGPRPAILP